MVSLETPSPPSTPPAAAPSLSPDASAFLAAYVACGSDILAAAGKLQISLENALDYFADPALKARLAALEDSEKRKARQTATAAVNLAITTLSRFTEAQWLSPNTLTAAVHLYRASIWLIRIAENKVPPDRLPARFSGAQSLPGRENIPPNGAPPVLTAHAAHSPKGESPRRFDAAVGATASFSPTPSPQPPVLIANAPQSGPALHAGSSAAERRQYVAPGGSPGFAVPQHSEPRRGDTSAPRDPRLTSLLSRAGAADSS